MNIINQIKEKIRFNRPMLISGTVLVAFLILNLMTCQSNINLRNQLRISEHNTQAALDTIHILKDKNGKLYSEKKSYIATVKDLKELNSGLYERIEQLNRQVRRLIIAGSNIDVKVSDTVVIDRYIPYHLDSMVNLTYKDESVNATTAITIRDKDIKLNSFTYGINIPLEIYFTSDYNVIARSSNDKVKFSKIESFIDPKITKLQNPPKYGLGLQIGLGGMYVYDFINQRQIPSVGVYVGLGFSRNFIKF